MRSNVAFLVLSPACYMQTCGGTLVAGPTGAIRPLRYLLTICHKFGFRIGGNQRDWLVTKTQVHQCSVEHKRRTVDSN